MLLINRSFASFFNFYRVKINRLKTLFFITRWDHTINGIRRLAKVVEPCLGNNSLQPIRQLLTDLRCDMLVETFGMLLKKLVPLLCLVCNLLLITKNILQLIVIHPLNEIRDSILEWGIIIRWLLLRFRSGRLKFLLPALGV